MMSTLSVVNKCEATSVQKKSGRPKPAAFIFVVLVASRVAYGTPWPE